MDIFKYAKQIWDICLDGKITKEELPAFLTALAGLIGAIVVIILPFIKGNAATVAKRTAAGIALAAGK
jgi:hypothetical protein